MFSRAHLLIEKEIKEINCSTEFTIHKLNENSIFELVAQIEGLPNTSWENGVFQVYLKFTERYNLEPPKAFFQTIPYHPNIDMTTGRPSLDFLDDSSKWKPDYNIKYILESIQQLLAFPLLDRAVNIDAVFMLKGNPSRYDSIVKQSVMASQRIKKVLREASFENNNINDKDKDSIDESIFSNRSDQDKFLNATAKFPLFRLKNKSSMPNAIVNNDNSKFEEKKTFKNISYEDYCVLWREIATTKSNKADENTYLKNDLFEDPKILSQHISISIKDLEDQVYRQLNEHKNIMYGKFDFGNRKNDLSQALMETRNNLHLPNSTIKNANNNSPEKMAQYQDISTKEKLIRVEASKKQVHQDDEMFEQEVDELINWTKNI